jgi:AraC-like DNA-binding protein
MNNKLKHIQDWLELAKRANWSVKKMAKECEVSVRALELYFLKTKSKPPKVWMIEERQRLAVEWLSGGASVKETSAMLGYKYANHFSREFKLFWGHSPTRLGTKAYNFRVLV